MLETHEIPVTRHARYVVDRCGVEAPDEVWLCLHGYGQLAADFLGGLAALRRPGRWLVAAEGPSRFYVKRSAGRVGASWMTKVGREREIEDTVAQLDAVLDAVLRSVPGEPPSVQLLGFSQGAAAACRYAALGSVPVRRVIAWAGGFPPDLDLGRWPQGHTELLLVVGEQDPWTSGERMLAEVQRLEDEGVTHQVLRFDGGHELDPDLLARLSRWED